MNYGAKRLSIYLNALASFDGFDKEVKAQCREALISQYNEKTNYWSDTVRRFADLFTWSAVEPTESWYALNSIFAIAMNKYKEDAWDVLW